MSANYQQFKIEFNKKIYVSTYDEFKRLVSKSHSGIVAGVCEKVFKAVLAAVLKNTTHRGQLYQGKKIITRQGNIAFVEQYRAPQKFELVFQKGPKFHSHYWRFKAISPDYTKVTFIHTIKNEHTVTGLNGKLGQFRFRREHRNQTRAMIKYLNRVCQDDSNVGKTKLPQLES
ncbi:MULTISPECIES: SRPBCC family protein [unclassified Mycoplasma]|uniref:SRPBCC family protein n=1 Tax=unclassified Mycoplasma TaxID=2683645 RepID=UPI000FDE383C